MLYSFDFEIRVEYVDTDQMGIVHNSNYFRFFEIGRTETIRSLGLSYKEIEDKGVMMPMVEQQCKYFLPAYYDEVLTIRTSIDVMPSSKFYFNYNIIRKEEDGKEALLSQGYNILAFIDTNTRKPKRCPEWIIEILSKKVGN